TVSKYEWLCRYATVWSDVSHCQRRPSGNAALLGEACGHGPSGLDQCVGDLRQALRNACRRPGDRDRAERAAAYDDGPRRGADVGQRLAAVDSDTLDANALEFRARLVEPCRIGDDRVQVGIAFARRPR